MHVITKLQELKKCYSNIIVTIGKFDGIHLGHQALFKACVNLAHEINGTSLAITFEPHPMQVFKPSKNLLLITPLKQKLSFMVEQALDAVLVIPFDESFVNLSAEDFIDKFLIGYLNIAGIVVGYDFVFGKKGLGSIKKLKNRAKICNFKLREIGAVMLGDEPISSTRVRQLVQKRDFRSVRCLLNRYYSIAGKVITGCGRGKKVLGFPTINLKILNGGLLPGSGVYAVLVEDENGNILMGATNIGINPTFGGRKVSIETYILDVEDNFYDKNVKIHFVEYIRAEKVFNSFKELSLQIVEDVRKIRGILEKRIRRYNNYKNTDFCR